MLSTWVVTPCYNEERRLPVQAFEAYLAERDDVGFCFVDANSDDGTGPLLREIVARHPDRTAFTATPGSHGKAQAVRAGVLHASERPGVERIGYWDADLAAPLSEVTRFIALFTERPEVRFVCGARVRRLGARIMRPAIRRYLGRAFATAAGRLLHMPVYDTQCGAKMLDAALAAELFAEPFLSQWVFDVELLARARRRLGDAFPEAVVELPLEAWEEVAGSRLRPTDFLWAGVQLVRIAAKYRRPAARD